MPAIRKAIGKIDSTVTKDLGHGVVEVVVATNNMDRQGERLDMKGLNTKDYSGVVLWGHDYYNFPIGKSLGLRKTADGKLISKTQFAIDEYDFANTAYKLVKNGYAPDVSIGFIPKEWDAESNTWTKSEMIEYSHVSIGANKDAKVTGKALDTIGLSADEFEEQVREHMIKMKRLEDEGKEPIEDDEMVTPDEAETKDETKVEVTLPDLQKLDKDPKVVKNVLSHLELIKSAISETEAGLKDLLTDTEPDKTKTIKKRIILVRTRKSLKTIDRVSEMALTEVKERLKEDE